MAFITPEDFIKIALLLVAVAVFLYVNRTGSRLGASLTQRIRPAKQTFTVGLVGSAVGFEKNAMNILFGAYDLFKRVGGKGDDFRFLVKTPSDSGFVGVLHNLRAACPVAVVGLVCRDPESGDAPDPAGEFVETIAVENWHADGDEAAAIAKHCDYLFFLATGPDAAAKALYDGFRRPKMMYDLTRPDFQKPVASSEN